MSTEAIYAKYWAALMDVEAVMVPADTAIALALRLAVQDAYAAGMETCSGMHDDLAAIVASQQQALQNALEQIDPLRAERNALYAQLAQLDADNADLTQRLHNLAGVQVEAQHLQQEIADLREQVIPDYQAELANLTAEIDRLTRQNAIAVDTFNSLHTNGNGVDPTAAAQPGDGWGRNHPAWKGLGDEERVWLYKLSSGAKKFSQTPLELRRELVRRVMVHQGGKPSMAQFDMVRPGWMAGSSGLIKTFACKWTELQAVAA